MQELSWKIMCLTHQNSKFEIWNSERMSHWENKISTLKTLNIQHTKYWMSWKLWKHEEFITEKEKDLFKILFLTARKQHVSTWSESESETSTKKSTERFDKESLFNMSIESSNIIINLFQQE